jgi:hypothetical protein
MYHDHDFQMTITGPNLWGAFRGIGVKYSIVDGVQRASFDEMTVRENEGFTGYGILTCLWGTCRREARFAGLAGLTTPSKMV